MARYINLDKKTVELKVEEKKITLVEMVNSHRRAYINKMLDSVTQLQNLVKDVIPIAKIAVEEEAGRNSLEKEVGELEKAVGELDKYMKESEQDSERLDQELFELILGEQFNLDWFQSLSYPQMEAIIDEVNKLNKIDLKNGVAVTPVIVGMIGQAQLEMLSQVK